MVKLAVGTTAIDNDGGAVEYSHYNITCDVGRSPLPFEEDSATVDIEVYFSMNYGTDAPTEYVLLYQRYLEDSNGIKTVPDQNIDNARGTIVSGKQYFKIEGLLQNRIYSFTLYARKNSAFGKDVTFDYRTPQTSKDALGLRSQGIDTTNLTAGKSYITITNDKKSNKLGDFKTYYRTFDGLDTAHNVAIGSKTVGGFATESYTKVNTTDVPICYSYGTIMYFDPSEQYPQQGAAVGFFIGSGGGSGYQLVIDTTQYSSSKGRKSIRVVKVGPGISPKEITDSQITQASTLTGVYEGTEYRINIKVKVLSSTITMKIYINDFLITAVDKTVVAGKTLNEIFKPTDVVSLTSRLGTAIFDYIYASEITLQQFNDNSYNPNFYDGQFSNDTLSAAFGDLTYYANSDTDIYTSKKTNVDEFGTTVREIQKNDIRFDSRPSYPIYWSAGANSSVKILGSTKTNFKGTSYVLNNTSTTVALSDGSTSSYFVLGNTLADGGQLTYITDEIADYSAKEPVSFESKWLQNEQDVKSFANWIKDNVINRGQIVKMSVFGNPLLSLGDIVTINYPIQGLIGEERFIITSIQHNYQTGMDTVIECRSLSKTAHEAVENSTPVASIDNTSTVDPVVKKDPSPLSPMGKGFELDPKVGRATDFGTGVNPDEIEWRISDNATATQIYRQADGQGNYDYLGTYMPPSGSRITKINMKTDIPIEWRQDGNDGKKMVLPIMLPINQNQGTKGYPEGRVWEFNV